MTTYHYGPTLTTIDENNTIAARWKWRIIWGTIGDGVEGGPELYPWLLASISQMTSHHPQAIIHSSTKMIIYGVNDDRGEDVRKITSLWINHPQPL